MAHCRIMVVGDLETQLRTLPLLPGQVFDRNIFHFEDRPSLAIKKGSVDGGEVVMVSHARAHQLDSMYLQCEAFEWSPDVVVTKGDWSRTSNMCGPITHPIRVVPVIGGDLTPWISSAVCLALNDNPYETITMKTTSRVRINSSSIRTTTSLVRITTFPLGLVFVIILPFIFFLILHIIVKFSMFLIRCTSTSLSLFMFLY